MMMMMMSLICVLDFGTWSVFELSYMGIRR